MLSRIKGRQHFAFFRYGPTEITGSFTGTFSYWYNLVKAHEEHCLYLLTVIVGFSCSVTGEEDKTKKIVVGITPCS
jgi:hypothetical protein